MHPGTRCAHALWMTFAACGVAYSQATPFESVATLSTDVVPIERSFEIPQAGGGQYRVTATDLGALLTVPEPAPLDNLQVIITRGRSLVTQFDDEEDDKSPTDSVTFDATPGTYVVHIVGKPGDKTGSGPINLRIEHVASGNVVLQLGDTLSPPETVVEGARSYRTEIDVPAGGYELRLADLEFPRPLQLAGVLLFQAGSPSPAARLCVPEVPGVCPATTTVTLPAGQYQLVAAAAVPTGSDAGVFSVHMQATAGGAVIHSRATDIGRIKKVSPADFQLDSSSHTLSLRDLQFPLTLASNTAIVTRAAQITALANATTPDPTFNVAANDTPYDVFAYAEPDTTAGAGTFTLQIRPGTSAPVLSALEAVGNAVGSTVAYTFKGNVTAAGNYRARLGDFAFPIALSSMRLAIVQNNSIFAQTAAGSVGPMHTLDLNNLAAGAVTAIAVVRPATVGGTVQQSGGTFGIDLVSTTAGATPVIDATQGIGGLISTRQTSILTAGRYDLTLSDLDAPEVFRDLMAVISRGATKLGVTTVGSGGVSPPGGTVTLSDIEASVAGNYSVTVLATPSSPLNAATYAIQLAQSPPGPTVTISAVPTEVTAGGRTRLTWSSQNATSCTASSNPAGVWTGSKAVSGSEDSVAINAATTFTLRCTGANTRASEQSVNITIAPPTSNAGGGGGGTFGWFGVLALAGFRVLALAARRR